MSKWQDFKIIHDGLCIFKYSQIFLLMTIVIAMIVMPFCLDINSLDIGSWVGVFALFVNGVLMSLLLCVIYFEEIIVPYRDFLVLKEIKGITAYEFIELVNHNESEKAKERKRIKEKEKMEKMEKIERKYSLKK